jgi:D-alanyl-D-alanine carboxypeptidase (penicillin-binding protein 5/6)
MPGVAHRASARTLARRRAALVAALALLAFAAFAAPRHLPGNDDASGAPLHDKSAREHPASAHGWPAQGQGAYAIGNGRTVASPHQKPVPIASVAKVMTAYIVLQHHPLDGGPSFVVTPSDVMDTEARRRDGQSVVSVRAGEQLTEQQALMAIMLPSANNVAVLVARQVSGSVSAFVAEMNRTARALGMSHTTYTDPSGYDDGTVSTARDQLRLARAAARNSTLAAIMATRSFWLPVAGTVTNTNSLLGRDGFVGMKTGSDRAAGGCFMFHSGAVIGVVLGQRGDNLIAAGLAAAEQLIDRLS